MTTEVPTSSQAAAYAYRDLQLALADVGMAFPEMTLSDTADGKLRINLGRVSVGTAAKLARTLKAAEL
ncbi:hypothetical protein SSP35_03_02930 [Streptomyces sp. NBRC 110611]|uniref:hypothetical protein n=1 Tax=Streptomyces sp. NBRC 110611 TaxID=1621259 RepID=UPI000833E283|nr:hypothetical protein [Streptomyces sp. NBRC 110611]GAU66645.1 hypothetical protein SSP35_03_02930 [Streptomyces sp. NBRC 110611]